MPIPALSVPLLQGQHAQSAFDRLPPGGPASLPVPHPTRSFWIDTPGANPLADAGSTGALTQEADVCVIGSGITGVGVAYHLAQMLGAGDQARSGVKVVIVEARDFCSGATGRNGGHLTPYVFRGFRRLASEHGPAGARRVLAFEDYTAASIVDIIKTHRLESEVDLVEGGHIMLLTTDEEEADMRADYEEARASGVDLTGVEMIDKETMQKTYGAAYPGMRYPGHNLWPLKFVTHAYKLAQAHIDLTLHTRTPVTSVTASPRGSRRAWTLHTPRGPIACAHVVHATNAYASHLLPRFAGPGGIVPTRGQVIALRANARLEELGTSSWDGNEGFEYWFPRPLHGSDAPDGRGDAHPLVILGGGREASGPGFEYYETDDSTLHPDVGRALKGFLHSAFPGKFADGRQPEMEWTGIMGYTQNEDPFVGPVADTKTKDGTTFRQYIAAGYTGHGMPRAFACAEVVASMIAAEVHGERWEQPEWLPDHYLTWNRPNKRG